MVNEMSLGMKWIKYMLLAVNCMFVLTAALIISVGTTVYAVYYEFRHFTDDYFGPAGLVIATGIILLFVSLFGCFGAARGSTCLINMFAVLLSVIFVLEISASIVAFSLRSDINGLVHENIETAMGEYGKDKELTAAIDFLQNEFRCCGIDSSDDWVNVNNNISLPSSCCTPSIPKCSIEDSYEDGCKTILVYFISKSAIIMGTGALMFAFIQLIGIIFAVMLAKSIRQAKTDRERRKWEIREQMASAYTQMERHQAKQIANPAPVIYIPTVGHSTT